MTMDEHDRLFEGAEINPLSDHQAIRVPFELDVDRYRGDIAEFEISEAEAMEVLQTLWSIMRSMVELGWDVDLCGQMLKSMDLTDTDES